jgi:membrane protein
MVILGYRVGPLVKKTAREVLDDNVLGLSAQGAYYFFFSLFPIFLFVAPLLGLVGDKRETFDRVIDQLRSAVPAEGFRIIADIVKQVVYAPGAPGLISLGAALALWAGSNVFSALIDALNQAYDIRDGRPWWEKRLIAVAAVLVAGAIIALSTITLVAGEDITRWLAAALQLSAAEQAIALVLQVLTAASLLVLVATLSLYYLPDCRQSFRHALAGGIVTTVLWVVVTLLFRLYVQNFGSYNKTYGTIGGVIVLLTWMYLSILVFLVGGELASELHRGTGAIAPRQGKLYGDRIETAETAAATSVDRIVALTPGR